MRWKLKVQSPCGTHGLCTFTSNFFWLLNIKVVSLSTSNYQIQYEIDALAHFHSAAAKAKAASYYVVTTANSGIANSVYKHGATRGVFVRHITAQYRLTNGGAEIRFGWQEAVRIKKTNEPVSNIYYMYGISIPMTF